MLPAVKLVQQIRQRPWGKKVIVVGLTGWARTEDRERYETAGFDSVVVKPIKYARLSGLLRGSLESKK
jgi:CheY-like chemotaxis protein